ncbi:MAG: hypothetical protein ISS74_02925 [Planctomycetes bacterium]|nr:hypothetical protein [Planctomycetota bacterium]
MRLPARAVAVVLLLAGCAGCSAPVLSVRHALPAALPMPAGTEAVRVGRFSVTPAGEQAAAAVLVDALRERLSAHWTVVGDGPAPAKAAEIAGDIRVVTDDARGTRPIRRYDQATGTWVSGEAPTLVRTASVHVTFRVARPGSGGPAFTAETDRAYRSTDDPRVRGELGLGRPDSPDRVPPAEGVVRELLAACAAEFAGMVAPQAVTAEIKTRASLNGTANKALKAIGEGNLEAGMILDALLEQHPDDINLRFNLAAVLEAAGDLDAALAQYKAVVERSGGKDAEAAAAADRVARVLARRKAG